MTPHTARNPVPQSLARRTFLASLGSLGLGVLSGCANPLFRGQSPELPVEEVKERKLIGDFTRPWGLNWLKVESIGLVTGLDNTGSDPPPGEQRQLLINEMQSHSVANPDKILASGQVSLVLVRGYLPPGAKEKDIIDLEVQVPRNSETTNLSGGFLMLSRMRRMEVLGGVIRRGDVDAAAKGNVITNAVFNGEDDKISRVRGRILGGGYVLESRKLGLTLRREDASIRISTLIGKAINSRFHMIDGSQKKGVAKPMRDNFLELDVAPRYKFNLSRYLRVVRNIILQETAVAKAERVQTLARKLQEPSAAPLAALQLEAIGKDAAEALKGGLANEDPEVRFYAAEALAYLDDQQAAPALEAAARESSAFRWHALTALASMKHPAAYSALSNLLHVVSAETRYGAFRAIRLHNDQDPNTKGELLDGKFNYHLVPTNGEPLIHVTRSKQPELVIFGDDQAIKPPEFLYAGTSIVLKGLPDGQIKISKFSAREGQDVSQVCPAKLNDVIRGVVAVGASYSDVIHMLREASKAGLLHGKFAIEALPQPNRKYMRGFEFDPHAPPAEGDDAEGVASQSATAETAGDPSSVATVRAATPEPELFQNRLNVNDEAPQREVTETYIDPEYRQQNKGILNRLNPLAR